MSIKPGGSGKARVGDMPMTQKTHETVWSRLKPQTKNSGDSARILQCLTRCIDRKKLSLSIDPRGCGSLPGRCDISQEESLFSHSSSPIGSVPAVGDFETRKRYTPASFPAEKHFGGESVTSQAPMLLTILLVIVGTS